MFKSTRACVIIEMQMAKADKAKNMNINTNTLSGLGCMKPRVYSSITKRGVEMPRRQRNHRRFTFHQKRTEMILTNAPGGRFTGVTSAGIVRITPSLG